MSRKPGQLITKDPQSVEPQGFDWTAYLAEIDDAETIASSTWAVSGSGLTLTSATVLAGSLKTQVTLNGGTVGSKYTVTNHIITSSGVEDDRSFFVKVEQR